MKLFLTFSLMIGSFVTHASGRLECDMREVTTNEYLLGGKYSIELINNDQGQAHSAKVYTTGVYPNAKAKLSYELNLNSESSDRNTYSAPDESEGQYVSFASFQQGKVGILTFTKPPKDYGSLEVSHFFCEEAE